MTVTGFSTATRALIIEREGFRCARCGDLGAQVHHRRPRGMGGTHSAATNRASNGVLLCRADHDWAESYRDAARVEGLLLSIEQNPATAPVWYRGQWMRLDDDGGLNPVAVEGSA